MKGIFGCAGIVAAIAFVFGIFGSLFATEANFAERLMLAVMPAAMAFVAVLILCSRDYARDAIAMRKVRKKLLARQHVNEDNYSALLPETDPTLNVQTRQAVSEFFDVPVQKIRPTDNFRSDLGFQGCEPRLHSFVLYHVLAARKIAPQPFTFNYGDVNEIGDLTKEIQRVLDGFDTGQ